MSLFKNIGSFFVSLFNKAKAAYDDLDSAEKEALQAGSGIVAIINSATAGTGAEIKSAIQERFPDLPIDKVEETVFAVAQTFGLPETMDNLEDVLEWLRDKLKAAESKKQWAWLSQSLASGFSILMSPDTTVFKKVAMLLEYVYQKYIKKTIPEDEG